MADSPLTLHLQQLHKMAFGKDSGKPVMYGQVLGPLVKFAVLHSQRAQVADAHQETQIVLGIKFRFGVIQTEYPQEFVAADQRRADQRADLALILLLEFVQVKAEILAYVLDKKRAGVPQDPMIEDIALFGLDDHPAVFFFCLKKAEVMALFVDHIQDAIAPAAADIGKSADAQVLGYRLHGQAGIYLLDNIF